MGKEVQKVNAERKRQRYSKEFKLAAVKLLQSGAKPGTLIAMELGIQLNAVKRVSIEISPATKSVGLFKIYKHWFASPRAPSLHK